MKFPLSNFADCSRACCFLSNTSRLLNQNSTALKVRGMEDKECNWMSTLVCKDLGVMHYLAAIEFQEKLVELKQREPSPDVLLFVEHPHVYTIGRGGKESNVLAAWEVAVYRTSRGGGVTYHGPGQLVVYVCIDLRSNLRTAVHRYVRNLEMTAIRMLKDLGLEGIRRPLYTGIWIGDKKIAAIGVAV